MSHILLLRLFYIMRDQVSPWRSKTSKIISAEVSVALLINHSWTMNIKSVISWWTLKSTEFLWTVQISLYRLKICYKDLLTFPFSTISEACLYIVVFSYLNLYQVRQTWEILELTHESLRNNWWMSTKQTSLLMVGSRDDDMATKNE